MKTRFVSFFILILISTFLASCSAVSVEPKARNEIRRAQIEAIINIGEAAVANPAFVSGPGWQQFVDGLEDESLLRLDDAEFRSEINRRVQDLPFTHFRLLWRSPTSWSSIPDADKITLSTPVPGVALLRVSAFDVEPEIMAERLGEVLIGAYRTLIIDLRGNEGGSFPSVVALSRFLVREPIDAGVFLTRGWFDDHGDYPDAAQRAAIPALATLDLAAFADQLGRDGAVRLILPAHDDRIFTGQVILLTDFETASASEPFVYLMQQRGIPVVGEPTAGAMLSADRIPVDETFVLFTPVADYLTADGVRLDRRGVAPDIDVPAGQALQAALALANQAD